MEKKYLEVLVRELEVRGFAKSTKVSYLAYSKRFVKSFEKPTAELGGDELKIFMQHLINDRSLQPNTINANRAAIVFFLRHVLKRNIIPGEVPQMKTPTKLPIVMSHDEVKQIFSSLTNVFYKSVLMVLYSSGIRNQELRQLKVSDVDSKKMTINIREGKGAKDRKVLLSAKCLDCLRVYWTKYRKDNPIKSEWLFIPQKTNSGITNKQLSPTAVAYIVNCAVKAAGIKKKLPLMFLGIPLQHT